MTVSVTVDTTPNENALKFSVNKKILDSGYKTFNSLEEAKDFPVAAKILENDNIASVFMMAEAEAGFISVTKKSDGNWSELKDIIIASIKATLWKPIFYLRYKKGTSMDTESYIMYGMIFGFLTLWLLFSLLKKLGDSSKFPKSKDVQDEK